MLKTKKDKMMVHKLAFELDSIINTLDEIKANSKITMNIKEKALELSILIEPFLESIYDSKLIRKGTYFQEMNNKIDTVIRQNFQEIIE